MVEFQKVMSELNRMCNTYGDSCGSCQIQRIKDNACKSCSNWIRYHSEEAERIIMRLAVEHPIVTNGMKFREVFEIDLDSIEVVYRDGEGKVSHHQDVNAWLNKEYKEGQE